MLERKKNNNQFDRILIVSPIRNLSVKKIQQQKFISKDPSSNRDKWRN